MSATQSLPSKGMRIMRVLVPLLSIPLTVFLLWFMLGAVGSLPEAPVGDTTFAWIGLLWPVFAGWLLVPLTFIYAFHKPKVTLYVSCSVISLFFIGVPLVFGHNPGDGFPVSLASIMIVLVFASLAMAPTIVMWFFEARRQPKA